MSAVRSVVDRLLARDEDLELDRVGVGAAARRQVRDDLAVRPRVRLELVERGVDRRERKRDAQLVERHPVLDVRAKPMLFVLGEHAEQARDRARIARRATRRPRARGARSRRATTRSASMSEAGSAPLPRSTREQVAVELDRAKHDVEHALRRARCARAAGRRAPLRARARAPTSSTRRRAPTGP